MIHTNFVLHRPVTTVIIFAAVATIGALAAKLLPLEQFPDITFPFMGVTIPYPGSTPEEIEEEITRPVEDALATLPGIREIRSRSEGDQSTFEIEFDWGTDILMARQVVAERLSLVGSALPPQVDRPVLAPISSIMGEIMLLALPMAAVVNVLLRYAHERYTQSHFYAGERPTIVLDSYVDKSVILDAAPKGNDEK